MDSLEEKVKKLEEEVEKLKLHQHPYLPVPYTVPTPMPPYPYYPYRDYPYAPFQTWCTSGTQI
jgi:hypothetical protein